MNQALPGEPVLATVLGGSDTIGAAIPVATPAEAHAVPTPGPMPIVKPAADAIPVAVATNSNIEARLATLEKEVAALKPTPEVEARIAERVLERLPKTVSKGGWASRLNPFRAPSIPMPSGWLLIDFATEIRFVVAAIVDGRFSMTWPSRGAISLTLLVAFTSFIWLAPIGLIPAVGSTLLWVLETIVNLLCGCVLFKLLHREAQRYRKFLETLP